MAVKPAIESLVETDSPGLAALEAAATAWSWSESQFRSSLASGGFGWGMRRPDGGAWVAFALFSQVLDEASLLNIATHPDWRRRGLARRLMSHGLHALRGRGAATVFLEVRVGNAGAIRLYRDFGFVESGLRRGYYPPLPAVPPAAAVAGREDALLMRTLLRPQAQ